MLRAHPSRVAGTEPISHGSAQRSGGATDRRSERLSHVGALRVREADAQAALSASYRTAFAGLGAMVLVSVHLGRREALVQILTARSRSPQPRRSCVSSPSSREDHPMTQQRAPPPILAIIGLLALALPAQARRTGRSPRRPRPRPATPRRSATDASAPSSANFSFA
jgi:hypothetical protein